LNVKTGQTVVLKLKMIIVKEQIVIQIPKPPITTKTKPKVNTPPTVPAMIKEPLRSTGTPPIMDIQYPLLKMDFELDFDTFFLLFQ
jgi:hypothetical protein